MATANLAPTTIRTAKYVISWVWEIKAWEIKAWEIKA
jgi:hypothetical protein